MSLKICGKLTRVRIVFLFVLLAFTASACQPQTTLLAGGEPMGEQAVEVSDELSPTQDALEATPFPLRPLYSPGELVDYIAQTGDSLPALAERFNTSIDEIQQANPFIPSGATTMPQGMPMKIPIYYKPLWGPNYRILPDSYFVNGPAVVNFNTQEFIDRYPGWIGGYREYASDAVRSGAEIIDLISRNYSVSPRLILALLEYQAGALSQPVLDPALKTYPLGYEAYDHQGLYPQLNWLANYLNNGYYAWRQGTLLELEHKSGRTERLDPWLNAATVALHQYFNYILDDSGYFHSIAHDGFAKTYQDLFGDPWINEVPHLPGSLTQPEFILPIEFGETWAFTGGPHSAWGIGEPMAALDFAPPVMGEKCSTAPNWTVAMATGTVVRSESGQVMLDLDGDGDERTGWNIFYLHIATEDRIPLGVVVKRGDPIGHPSCEGGRSTGSHIHVARKYNGEWIPSQGVLAFTLDGWVAKNGSEAYRGTLERGSQTVIANVNSPSGSFIQSERR